jgi:hypothetical protein
LTIALSEIGDPLIFPVIVATPVAVDEVRIAVYVPSAYDHAGYYFEIAVSLQQGMEFILPDCT